MSISWNQKIRGPVIWGLFLALIMGGCGATKDSKVYHVGILSGLGAFAPAADGFKSKMTELGYVEGKNIVYDVQSTDVDITAYQTITKKFVENDVDLIFAFPTEAAMEAKAAASGTDIPVVFTLAFTDGEGVNLINSITEPGGNITGVRFPSVTIASKRLDILMEMAPLAKRILVPYLQGYPNVPGQLDAIRSDAKASGLTLIECGVSTPDELKLKLDSLVNGDDPGVDGILLIAEPVSITPAFYSVLGKFAYEHHLPIGGAIMDVDGYASIFGYLPDAQHEGGEAALIADKIFRGVPAGTIPVMTSDPVLEINYKAAQNLDVIVLAGLLKQADLIIR